MSGRLIGASRVGASRTARGVRPINQARRVNGLLPDPRFDVWGMSKPIEAVERVTRSSLPTQRQVRQLSSLSQI